MGVRTQKPTGGVNDAEYYLSIVLMALLMWAAIMLSQQAEASKEANVPPPVSTACAAHGSYSLVKNELEPKVIFGYGYDTTHAAWIKSDAVEPMSVDNGRVEVSSPGVVSVLAYSGPCE